MGGGGSFIVEYAAHSTSAEHRCDRLNGYLASANV